MHPRTQIHFISHDRTCVKCENGQICRPDAIYIAHPGILCVLPCAAGGLHSGSSATCPWKSHKSHLIQCVTHFTPPYTSTIYSTRNAFTPAKHFKRIRSLIVRRSLCTNMLHMESNGWGWGNMSKKRWRGGGEKTLTLHLSSGVFYVETIARDKHFTQFRYSL